MDVAAIPVLVIVPQFGGRWHDREDPLGRKFNVILGAIGALTLASVSSAIGPSISSQAAPGVNFSAYRTYSWVNTMPPAGLNPVMYQQILADIDRSFPAEYDYLLHRCGGRALAEDLTSETVLATVDRVQSGQLGSIETGYLIGIARHKLVDHWRRQFEAALQRVVERANAALAGLPVA